MIDPLRMFFRKANIAPSSQYIPLGRFPNGPCAGGNNMIGTCYTEAECESRGGTNGGTCASGFGVCCVCKLYLSSSVPHMISQIQIMLCFRLGIVHLIIWFFFFWYLAVTVSCGETSSENCTFFNSGAGGGIMSGGCQVTICPISSNICQVRFFLFSPFFSFLKGE